MNNEFNNNGEYTDNNVNQTSTNADNSPETNSNQDNSYNSGDYYNYYSNQGNEQPGYSYPSYVYPSQDVTVEKKPKKKRKLFNIMKFTAAAVAFGLIAGGTFQAYYMITQPDKAENEEDNLQITQVSQTDNSGDTITPQTASAYGLITDVSDVVEKVMPSIVAINSTANVTSYDFFGREFSQPSQGSGSGFIIGQNGSELLIVTNNHVIDSAETVEIVFVDNTKASAVIKGADAQSDLAVVSVDMSDLSEETAAAIKVATLGDSDDVKAGEMAIAIGNALGYGQSVTVGYISAVNREVTIDNQTMTLLQTDAAINPGNSGGALLNSAGQVIGINSVKYADTNVEGMGYAIPISSALPMINELIDRQTIAAEDQGFLGIDAATAQNVTQEYAARFNMPIGVYVNTVIEGSPAEDAGLMQGDIITGLDNSKIETVDDLVSALSYKKAGQQVKLIVQTKENGAYVEKSLDVTLGNKN